MYLRGTYQKDYKEQDLVSWSTLKHQLNLDDDTFKELVESFAQSEVHNAEIYCNRALIDGQITAHFDVAGCLVQGLWLPMPLKLDYEEADLTVTVDGTEKAASEYTVIPDGTTKILFTTGITNAKYIKVVYNPDVYNHRKDLIPGILMKVTQYFTNRENTSESRYTSSDPAQSIYSRHRIKTSF